MKKTNVTIMRAGTSKGIFIDEKELPKNQEERDKLILKIFGSPDVRQIDGLGGADPLTSKLAIIAPPSREDADVDYTFGQVSYVSPKIDYSGNCGNISSGVGPYAVDQGLVEVTEPITTVRVHNTNTGKLLIEEVEVENGRAKTTGDQAIAGVVGTGSPIVLDFSDTAGAATGKLLPTGNAVDQLDITGHGKIDVSLVDAANAVVFVRAKDLKLRGNETPEEIDSNAELLATLEEIRAKGAEKMGMIDDWTKAKAEIPAFPMVAFVSPAQDYVDFTTGNTIKAEDVDFLSRLLFMQVTHKTYAGTATICTGAAACIKGTLVNEVVKDNERFGENVQTLAIGHPAGVITVDCAAVETEDGWVLKKAAIKRTARRIMDGVCYTNE